ncbi:hypothetical protein [Planomonospora venezuelensis]|uniref:Tetratricopeptide (TPR) repeat protein n=1 Tax=Planomonospora venezuelensis TaxID=1999 RepID=A0A841CYZ9_PLAVE|nr:hypothetical protein [Planomonospora venezuelensis]MBB5963602.1 tetratricopeptide (TPR) repeat protein [Planomonospora venezuelensis]GIN01390.1 hypothetical protein Pve01_30480 [Planomonospora venezuelensis]
MIPKGTGLRPFVGLRPFTRDDQVRFFGRGRESAELARRWRTHRLTVVHGPPGAGKTSLLSAGVLPLIHHAAADVLPVGRLSRSSAVPAALVSAEDDPHVFALLSSWAPHQAPAGFIGQTVSGFLRRRPARFEPSGARLPVLAAVDHAEELYTGSLAEPRPALDQLVEALDGNPHLRLLLVVDDEHLDPLTGHEGLRRHLGGEPYELGALGAGPAREACGLPLEDLHWTFGPGVVESLVNDLRRVPEGLLDTVEPAYLQVACTALWGAVRDGPRTITGDDLAGVDGILAGFCRLMIEEVAHDHFHGDTGELTGLLRRLARGGTGEDKALPDRVVTALSDRHILRHERSAGGYGIHRRLVRPLLLDALDLPGGLDGSGAREARCGDPAGDLLAAETALHEGHFDLAVTYAGRFGRRPGGDERLHARVESLLGDVSYLRGDSADAIARYRRAAELYTSVRGADRTVAALLTAVGRILIDRGAFGAAVRELRAAVRRSPDEPAIHTELAWALWYDGRESNAVDELNDALAREGNAPEALRARGEIMSDLERPERALRDLDRVRPLRRSSTKAAYALALALTGDVSNAVRVIPPLDAEQDGSTLLRAARVMKAAGDMPEAVRLARLARQSADRPLPPRLDAEAERLITG